MLSGEVLTVFAHNAATIAPYASCPNRRGWVGATTYLGTVMQTPFDIVQLRQSTMALAALSTV